MKKIFIGLLILFCAIVQVNYISAQTSRGRYVTVIDPMFYDESVSKESWLIYSAKIEEDMNEFYRRNRRGTYAISFEAELNARRYMMFYYSVTKNENSIIDNYLEEMIKINGAGLFNEYVFICFNQDSWRRNNNLKLEEFANWMRSNMPDHIPLTLIWHERR
jgi:hypothetical protein